VSARPIRCPHGTDLTSHHATLKHSVTAVYTDGCRSTSGTPPRFWCGPGEMSKPNGVSVFESEYLRDWREALDEEFCRWTERKRQAEDYANYLRDWDEALVLNAGDELYDEAAKLNRISDGLASIARNTIERWTCGCVMNSADAHRGECPDFPNLWVEEREYGLREHADYLGEVPWSDRVDD
jgi:hypothetical protein